MNLNSLTFLALHCVITGEESLSVHVESSKYSLLFNKPLTGEYLPSSHIFSYKKLPATWPIYLHAPSTYLLRVFCS